MHDESGKPTRSSYKVNTFSYLGRVLAVLLWVTVWPLGSLRAQDSPATEQFVQQAPASLQRHLSEALRLLPTTIKEQLPLANSTEQPAIEIKIGTNKVTPDYSNCGDPSMASDNLVSYKTHWSSRSSNSSFNSSEYAEEVQYKTLVINKQMVADANTKPNMKTCRHGDVETLLLASLINGLVRAFDKYNKNVAKKEFEEIHCPDDIHNAALYPNEVICKKIAFTSGAVSSNLQFVALAELATKKSNSLAKRRLGEGTPPVDLRELDSARDSFAVNMEYLILDWDYPCRRPAMARFLANELNYEIAGRCLLESALTLKTPSRPRVNFVPESIKSVHLIYATPGETLYQRWGHTMLRVSSCAEGCAPENDFAFSYYGKVTDFFSGFDGSAPGEISAYPYSERKSAYEENDRQVESYKIELTAEELRQFIYALIEAYNIYLYQWNNLFKNCTTEVLRLLQASSANPMFHNIDISKPASLIESLKNENLVRRSKGELK